MAAIIAEALVGVWAWWRRRRKSHAPRWQEAAANELREVRELVSRQETFRQFCHDTCQILRDFFIPHHGNDHRPHALRTRSLAVYVVAAVLVKLAASGVLFWYYPNAARMARIIAQEIVTLANLSRQAAGVSALRLDSVLVASAQAKGQDMIGRDYFAHDSPDGKKPWSWINRDEYDYVYAGENLAVDFVTADAVHQAFMKSPSHRANILNPSYQDIGVAVIEGTLAGRQTELLVEFFGTRRASVAPGAKPATTPAVPTTVAKTAGPRIRPPATPTPSRVARSVPTPQVAANTAPPESAKPTELAAPPALAPTDVSNGAAPGEDVGPALPSEPILVLGTESRTDEVIAFVLQFSNFFLLALVIFLTIALLLNIFIRIRVQHPDVILQTLAALALLAALILTKLHFVEQVGRQLRIL